MLLRYFFRVLEIGRLRQTTAPGAEPVEHAPKRVIGERERANLVGVISGAAYVVSNSTRTCANQCKCKICNPHLTGAPYVFRVCMCVYVYILIIPVA